MLHDQGHVTLPSQNENCLLASSRVSQRGSGATFKYTYIFEPTLALNHNTIGKTLHLYFNNEHKAWETLYLVQKFFYYLFNAAFSSIIHATRLLYLKTS